MENFTLKNKNFSSKFDFLLKNKKFICSTFDILLRNLIFCSEGVENYLIWLRKGSELFDLAQKYF